MQQCQHHHCAVTLLARSLAITAEIDRALAAPSLAEKVDGLLRSAAPSVNYPTLTPEEFDSAEMGNIALVGKLRTCGCKTVGHGDTVRKECETHTDHKFEPIMHTTPPFVTRFGHASDERCGAAGCKCVLIFDS